jgi:hypothetical protein
MKLGATDELSVPVDVGVLAERVAAALERAGSPGPRERTP